MKNRVQYMLSLPVVIALTFATAAWAKTYTLYATPVDPGATGTIDAKAPKAGGNTEITVKVDHLARPTLLTPAANEYVVWVQPDNGQPQNEGVLSVGDNEKGDLKITTSASKFAVLVTAENAAHAQTPSNRVVLRANVLE